MPERNPRRNGEREFFEKHYRSFKAGFEKCYASQLNEEIYRYFINQAKEFGSPQSRAREVRKEGDLLILIVPHKNIWYPLVWSFTSKSITSVLQPSCLSTTQSVDGSDIRFIAPSISAALPPRPPHFLR